ncbi:MAG: U32 family peptidase [Clostridiales bacterium]|jgi:putative protease|nr:U32 family peptidase [Clostridiales bacterium]
MSLELLAPAGDFACLKAAVSKGCDAVYLGAKMFSARSGAANFDLAEFQEAADYCHLRGVKVYAAVNTLCKDSEILDALGLVKALAELGADAFIVQDIGLAALAKKSWPELKLHASTQMAAQSVSDVRFLVKNKFDRVILARECSIQDIAAASAVAEIEVFVHGALCVCFSGKCLMSSLLGGRSGNRGKCAQPCRLSYRLERNKQEIASGHLLSPKDLCALSEIKNISKAGATSVKIEGRMRTPAYVAAAVSAYRMAIDNPEMNFDELAQELLRVFNRGGAFTQGYFSQHAGRDMMSTEHSGHFGIQAGVVQSSTKAGFNVKAALPIVPGDGLEIRVGQDQNPGAFSSKKALPGEVFPLHAQGHAKPGTPVFKTFDKTLNDRVLSSIKDNRKILANAFFSGKAGEPARLRLEYNGAVAQSVSAPLDPAIGKPSSREEVMDRLSKTGGTSFIINWASFESAEDFFLPASVANGLRRDACDLLGEKIKESFRKKLPVPTQLPDLAPRTSQHKLSVSVPKAALADIALQEGVDRLVIPMAETLRLLGSGLESLIDLCKGKGAGLFCSLPATVSEEEAQALSQAPLDGLYCSSWGQLEQFASSGKTLIAGYELRSFNKASTSFLLNFCQGVVMSPELSFENLKAASSAQSELVAYGQLPLMETRQCPIGNFASSRGQKFCSLKDKAGDSCVLIDRKSIRFPLVPDCGRCVCQILNQTPQDWSRRAKDVLSLPAGRLLLLFTLESRDEIKRMVSSWSGALQGQYASGDAPFTYGMLFRGVE